MDRGDGVCLVKDVVVLDVQYWPFLGPPRGEEMLYVGDEVGCRAGTPIGWCALDETLLEVDDKENRGQRIFGRHALCRAEEPEMRASSD